MYYVKGNAFRLGSAIHCRHEVKGLKRQIFEKTNYINLGFSKRSFPW